MRPYNLNSVGGGILTWSLGVSGHRLQGTRLSARTVKACLSIDCMHTLPSYPAVNAHEAVQDSVAPWGLGQHSCSHCLGGRLGSLQSGWACGLVSLGPGHPGHNCLWTACLPACLPAWELLPGNKSSQPLRPEAKQSSNLVLGIIF